MADQRRPIEPRALASLGMYLGTKNLFYDPTKDLIESGTYSNVYRIHRVLAAPSASTTDSPTPTSPPVSPDFAAKVINRHVTTDNYWHNHLPMEIYVTTQLRHANIIRVFRIARLESDTVVILMEFAASSIAAMISTNGHYPESPGRYLFAQVLSALNYMHHKSIAHRDLKVENLLLTKSTVAKIADFSYSLRVDPMNPLSTVFCGSVPYFSPQIFQGAPHNPLPADVWALGVCLYVMLNNGIPFEMRAEEGGGLLRRQVARDWAFKRRVAGHLTRECFNFISKMLEPDVDKRASVDVLQKDGWLVMELPAETSAALGAAASD